MPQLKDVYMDIRMKPSIEFAFLDDDAVWSCIISLCRASVFNGFNR